MAKQIGIIRFSGKLGETVGRKANYKGTETIGKRATSVRNPKSTLQCVQRMIAGTVGSSLGFFSAVLNNSIEGKSRGAETLAYLRSQWMKMLRTANMLQADNGFRYAKKGQGEFIANPYIVAKGSLSPLTATLASNVLAVSEMADAPAATMVASELFPTVKVGDQITILAFIVDSTGDLYPIHKVCRFAFKDDTTPVLDAQGNLVAAAVDTTKADGEWNKLEFGSTGISLAALAPTGFAVAAAAIIVSRKDGEKRSDSFFVLDASVTNKPGETAQNAVVTYGENAVVIDAASDIYLNNDVPNAGTITIEP